MVRLFATSLLISTLAFAEAPKQVNMQVGHTTTLSMPAAVSAVKIDDPSLVEVKTQGRKVSFVARAKGNTDVTVQTADGPVRFHVYISGDKYGLPY
jgi:Flp pilus assembly secretin CpaC